MPMLRLDKLLCSQGGGTRSEVRALLRAGRVRVNGAPARDPAQKIDPETNEVTLDGRTLRYSAHVYIVMNKPTGVVSASRDPKARTVLDLLPPDLRRPGLFPAGRLDKDTEGLLLITDDGAFAHDILAPRRHVEKEYLAALDAPVGEEEARRFAAGLTLEDGLCCLPAQMRPLPENRAAVVLREGKYHQVRRMFAACGRQVLRLRRVRMGGFALPADLPPGCARLLGENEAELIKLHNSL